MFHKQLYGKRRQTQNCFHREKDKWEKVRHLMMKIGRFVSMWDSFNNNNE